MDPSKLSTSDRVIAASGVVLFVASFLPWFKLDIFGQTFTANGWDVGFFWAGIPALLGLAATASILASRLGDVQLPELPVGWGQAYFVAGAVSAVIVLLKLVIGEDVVDRAWGLFVAALGAGAFAYGGFLAFQRDKGGAGPTPY